MARIGEDEIERLKQEVSLERLAQSSGVRLEKRGKDLHGRCPFHDDREPSLVISPDTNLWHCFGECQAGGSVIDWVMRRERVSFRHAVELLREGLPSLAASASEKASRRKPLAKLERGVEDEKLMLQVVDYYHATLKESPEALAYLEKRGLRSAELIDHFRLGFANRTLGYRLPPRGTKDGDAMKARLQELGILRSSGHEHLNGSLVVPVLDGEGRVAEMYGRKVGTKLRRGTPNHLYLPGPHRGVWNEAALRSSREVILCESLIDAMTFWVAGYRHVTTSYGTEGFTDDHRRALEEHGIERVLIAYDRDAAGDRAAEKLAAELGAMGIDVFRVLLPKGLDVNEYALKVQPASKSLELVLRQAQWLGEGSPRGLPLSQTDAGDGVDAIELATEPADDEAEDAAAELDAAEAAEAPPESDPFPLLAADEPPPPAAAPPSSEPTQPTRERPAQPEVATESGELVLRFGDRRWRVRGLEKNTTPDSLKVNLLVARDSGTFHVDTLELYSARQRAAYVKLAADELGLEERVVKSELGKVLLQLEQHQEAQLQEALEPKDAAPTVSEADEREALELLRDPRLLERILEDFERCGVVGEQTNKLVGYLAAASRKLDEPLAVVIQSSSAAGKSSLMEAILALMPEEDRVQYSAMTGQSLFYMGERDLKHKILAIVEEEGAERASYALKLLQSEGELTIASTGKDPSTGRLVTQEYRVEGPVMIFLTTTAIEIDEELLNRCLVLSVDEGREQTRAIHRKQRAAQTLEGVLAKQDKSRIVGLHRNAQRLLRPLTVVNPHANELTFLDHATRTRRDHMKYLTLIRTIALLHQYQRPVKTVEHRGETVRYIEVSRSDIATANRLCHEVLGRSLDELPPQTRRLLELVCELVQRECGRLGLDRGDYRFSRRLVREHTGWGQTQLRIHLDRLVEMEHLVVHRGGRGQAFLYELAYEPKSDRGGAPSLPGLSAPGEGEAEAAKEGSGTAPTWRGLAAPWRGDDGPVAGQPVGEKPCENADSPESWRGEPENPEPGSKKRRRRNARVVALRPKEHSPGEALAASAERG